VGCSLFVSYDDLHRQVQAGGLGHAAQRETGLLQGLRQVDGAAVDQPGPAALRPLVDLPHEPRAPARAQRDRAQAPTRAQHSPAARQQKW
jgi:hypothetical protein